MGRSLATVVLTLSLFGSVESARAEDDATSLDDLDLVRLLNVEVSTATKTAESVDDAPAVITVVTREDIVRWGYQSVADVLQHTLGFYVIDDHILPNAGVRGVSGGLGAESSVIKVLIDGRSVAFRSTSGNWLGLELVPLESIAQIEIIRGPASALYGADAFLGVVNIITQPPDETRPVRARVVGGYTGENPGGLFDVVGGGVFGNFDLMLGAAGEMTDRSGLELPEESPAPILPSDIGTRRTANNLERRSLVLQSRLGYRIANRGHVSLTGYASGIERGGDFAPWAQLTNRQAAEGEVGTVVQLGQYRVNLAADFVVAKPLTLVLQSSYFQGGVLPGDRVETGSDVFYVERKVAYRGVDSMLEAHYAPHPRVHGILGTEVVFDHERLPTAERVDRVTGDSVPVRGDASAQRPTSVDLVNVGTYLSINYKAFDPWLKLTGGLRYDHHSKYGDQVTGRLGATSRWTRALVTKLLYGSAFKAPSPYLLYAVPLRPGDVVGSTELKPQTIHTVEFQGSWKPLRLFGLTSGVSHSWLLDKAEFTPQGINQTARNAAEQKSLAWETRADVRFHEDVIAYAAAEWVRSRRELGLEGYAASVIGSETVAYPPWILRAGLSVRIPSLPALPLEASAQTVLVGPRRAADASIVQQGESYELPTYALLNLSLATRELYLARGHESRIAIRARNVLGATGPDPGFSGFELPLAPREILLELRHTY